MKITPTQRQALERAIRNGGSLQLGGLDADPVHRDDIDRLVTQGMLSFLVGANAGLFAEVYVITEAGREAVERTN